MTTRLTRAALLTLALALGAPARSNGQDDVDQTIIVNGQRPVLTAGQWKVYETAFRMEGGGGGQTRHGDRSYYECFGKGDMDRLLFVLMTGRTGEFSGQCDPLTTRLAKGMLQASVTCRTGSTMSVKLRAPYDPEVIEARIDMEIRLSGPRSHGASSFRRTSHAEYVAQCAT